MTNKSSFVPLSDNYLQCAYSCKYISLCPHKWTLDCFFLSIYAFPYMPTFITKYRHHCADDTITVEAGVRGVETFLRRKLVGWYGHILRREADDISNAFLVMRLGETGKRIIKDRAEGEHQE